MKSVGIDDPYTAGWFAAAVAISKVAAAGGNPLSSQICLDLNPWGHEDDTVERLCRGISGVAGNYQQDLPGFTLGQGTLEHDIIIAINQLGSVDSGQPAQLPGPKAGDSILVTNTLGDAITTIDVAKHKLYGSEEERHRLIKENIEIKPRVNEALAARRSGLATSVQLTYRGLSTDLQYLSRATGLGARIDLGSLPLSDEMKKWAPMLDDMDKDPIFIAGSGNEDYELMITCAKEHADMLTRIIREAGSTATAVGEIISEPGVFLEYPDGTVIPEPRGWRHF